MQSIVRGQVHPPAACAFAPRRSRDVCRRRVCVTAVLERKRDEVTDQREGSRGRAVKLNGKGDHEAPGQRAWMFGLFGPGAVMAAAVPELKSMNGSSRLASDKQSGTADALRAGPAASIGKGPTGDRWRRAVGDNVALGVRHSPIAGRDDDTSVLQGFSDASHRTSSSGRVTPDWLPDWADPTDPSSDMRRWIIPFVLSPFLASQLLRVAVFDPVLERELERRSPLFALRAEQEEQVERRIQQFVGHIQFETLLGRAPPLTEAELNATLRAEALHLEREVRVENREAVANFVTDSTFFALVAVNIVARLDEVRKLRRVLGREFFSMSSTRQAFILLLVSDVLVGYHSAEGWATTLGYISHHYGLADREDLVNIFVAVVPVAMDVLFKFWVFKYLRDYSPDTQVILEEIDRH